MILDGYGRPAKVAARYEAAYNSSVRSSINAPARSSTRDTRKFTRKRLLELSRYFYQNSPTFVGIIERLIAYVVGSGHFVRAKTSDAEFNAQADAYFKNWCNDTNYSTPMNWLTLQNVIVRSMFVDGDVGSCMCISGNRPYVQQIESHLITDRNNADWDKPDGVICNAAGRVSGYNVATNDDETEFTKVPTSRFILHFYPLRPNQYRGLPVATAALITIHDLDDILALEKQAVKTVSARTTVITSEGDADDGPSNNVFEGRVSGANVQSREDYENEVSERIEQAYTAFLRPGQDVKSLYCDRPGPAWQGFVEFLSNSIAICTGVPVSVIYGNKVGGADTRRELATTVRATAHWQGRLCWQLQGIYEYVINYACEHGLITVPRPSDWQETLWLHPAQATVDIGHDYMTDLKLVQAGLMSLEAFCAKNGKNWRDLVEQIMLEKAYIQVHAQKHGVNPALVLDVFKDQQPQPQQDDQSAQAKLAEARCKPGQCYHKWGKGDSGHKKGNKQNTGMDRQAVKRKYGALAEKVAGKNDALDKVNKSDGYSVTGADKIKSDFTKKSLSHIYDKSHSPKVAKKRMREFQIAVDTTSTGKYIKTLSGSGKKQTEFFKAYKTGKSEDFYYTARRGEDGVVYSWHQINKKTYNKKMTEWKRQQKDKKRRL